VPAAAVVPGLDPFEDGGADVSTERQACRSSFSIFIVPIRLSHIALSSASPTEPMLSTRPSAARRRVNANEVY
jgi:hypothetical protein